MKINKMWAMFNKNGILYRWTVEDTRREVIKCIEDSWGMKWRHLYKQGGFRIKKVVVLPIDAAGNFLPGEGDNHD